SNSNMATPFFVAPQEQQQTSSSSGNHAIMTIMNSRQHSKLTANIYGIQNNTVLSNPSNVIMGSSGSMAMIPQQQFVNNGNNVANHNMINSSNSIVLHNSNVSRLDTITSANVVNSSNIIHSFASVNGNSLPQQQVQIAGLNGITFTLPQSSLNQTGLSVPRSLGRNNDTIDAVTLSSLNGTVPEFLYQLTKMLTDEGNKEVIEWNSGMKFGGHQIGGIEVHNPKRMEEEVLGKYYRHSKYSSFQRQLNYFGFRKIAGKGKMSPCSYINDMATSDIRSLLLIKRKGALKGSVGADEESTVDSDNGKTCSSEDAKSGNSVNNGSICGSKNTGTKKRPLPGIEFGSSNTSARQIVSVVASGPPPTFSNAPPSSATTFSGDDCKRIKADSSNTNGYIAATDNNESFGIIFTGQNGGNNGSTLPSNTQNGYFPTSYNASIGEGAQRQLNDYLNRDSFNNTAGTIVSNNPSVGALSSLPSSSTSSASSASHATCSIPNNNNFNSYLSHPSSHHASSVPAPLQFLDPSELGMSIESSLNELKSNFNAANRLAAASSSPPTSLPTPSYSYTTANTSGLGATNSAPPITSSTTSTTPASALYFPNTPSMGSTKPNMAMLSRDDSLINLAMLPMMDSGCDLTPYDSSYFNNENTGGLLHRDDSLIELAASVERTTHGNAASAENAASDLMDDSNSHRYGHNEDDGGDTFSFIDFPGQT
ncbi:hypothetical protein HJC23_010117, partial [Cyclotella cryptica]